MKPASTNGPDLSLASGTGLCDFGTGSPWQRPASRISPFRPSVFRHATVRFPSCKGTIASSRSGPSARTPGSASSDCWSTRRSTSVRFRSGWRLAVQRVEASPHPARGRFARGREARPHPPVCACGRHPARCRGRRDAGPRLLQLSVQRSTRGRPHTGDTLASQSPRQTRRALSHGETARVALIWGGGDDGAPRATTPSGPILRRSIRPPSIRQASGTGTRCSRPPSTVSANRAR